MPEKNFAKKRVLIFGIDGATWKIISPLIEQGTLQNFRRMIVEGASGNLFCPDPVLSPVAWTTLATGVPKEIHGISDFGGKDEEGNETLYNSKNVNTNTLWEIVEGNGRNAVVINWPYTWPVNEKLGSTVVPGIAYVPGRKVIVHPKEGLALKIRQAVFTAKGKFLRGLLKKRFPEGLDEQDFPLPPIVRHFFKADEWDFFGVCWQSANVIQHNHWKHFEPQFFGVSKQEAEKFVDKIPAAYIALDNFLGEILKGAGENTTIIVLSDHGFGRSDFHAYSKIRPSLFFRWNIFLQKLGLLDFFPPDYNPVVHVNQEIDWQKTKAYFKNDFENGVCGVSINLAGREEHGIVSQKDFAQEKKKIIPLLESAVFPATGQKIFSSVRENPNPGKGAPDIIAELEPGLPDCEASIKEDFLCGEVSVEGKSLGKCFSTKIRWTANHSNKGIFIIRGKGVKKGFKADFKNMDIAPTALYCMGLAIPTYFQGKVLDVFSEEWLASNPVKKANIGADQFKPGKSEKKASSKEEEEVWEELRKMGYAV